MSTLPSWFDRYFPETIKIDRREKARSIAGAVIGIFLTGVLSHLFIDAHSTLPWLVAPMGASAVLLFVAPASPLAQPWSVIGGNITSALIGICCSYLIDTPLLAAAVAVGAAIGTMFLLRCTHPPGGAIALSMVLGGPAIASQGVKFAFFPIGLNSLLLVTAAIAYNNLCGRRYPHIAIDHSKQHKTKDLPPSERLGITPGDLDAVLKQYNQVLDISPDDLEEIFMQVEMHAYQRRFGLVTCADIMSRDVVKVEFSTELQEAWDLLEKHQVKALPVVNRFDRVIGIVTKADFFAACQLDTVDDLPTKLRRMLKRTPSTHSDKPEVVGQIMATKIRTCLATFPIVHLVSLLSNEGFHQVPIVDTNDRLVGMVTQSDLVAALYQSDLEKIKTNSRKELRLVK
jgi:CBS domain-containing membrane protein